MICHIRDKIISERPISVVNFFHRFGKHVGKEILRCRDVLNPLVNLAVAAENVLIYRSGVKPAQEIRYRLPLFKVLLLVLAKLGENLSQVVLKIVLVALDIFRPPFAYILVECHSFMV